LLSDPSQWLPKDESVVVAKLNELAREVVAHINDYVDEQQKTTAADGTDFDAKTVFKSQAGVAPLQTRVTTFARWMGNKDVDYLFNVTPS
jgi:hypothetical protein